MDQAPGQSTFKLIAYDLNQDGRWHGTEYVSDGREGRISYLRLIEGRGSEIGLTDNLNADAQKLYAGGLRSVGRLPLLASEARISVDCCRRTKVELFEEIRKEYEHGAGAKEQYSAIVLGATGNVGGRIVQLLDLEPAVQESGGGDVRRKTDAFADPKVSEVVVNMDRLEEEVAPHAQGVDVALAAFGVGKGSAKMPEEEVRKIEITYPQAFCRAARAGGARVCGVMTAVGADPGAGMKYAKIIGEKENAVASVKFDFLGLYRPAGILGNSNTPGVLGYVMPLLHWAMPSKYHSIHKNDLARAMVAQSEQAFLAIAQGNAPKEATVKILEYKEMEPFFVKGESD